MPDVFWWIVGAAAIFFAVILFPTVWGYLVGAWWVWTTYRIRVGPFITKRRAETVAGRRGTNAIDPALRGKMYLEYRPGLYYKWKKGREG